MMGLDEVLAPLSAQAFLRNYWLKSFVHVPGKSGRFADLLTWEELGAILEQHRLTPPRFRLYKEGQAIDPARYLTPAMFGVPRLDAGGLALCLAQGASLVLDDAQELAPRVRELMQTFQEALHTDAFANLYAGWHSQRAFNRHWDPQEAIIIQLYGRKHWTVYRPTRPHPLKNDLEPPIPPAGLPFWEGNITDGDVLYIPRGWWHEAHPLNEPSLHLTISLTPPTAMDYLAWAVSRLRGHQDMRASLPAGDEAALSAASESITTLLAGLLQSAPLGTFLQEWDANIRPNPHIQLKAAPYEQLAGVFQESLVRLATLHRLSITPHAEDFEFFAAGRLWTVPKTLQPALSMLHNGRELRVTELIGALLDPSATTDLIKSLNVLAQAGVILVRNANPTPP